MADDQVLTRHDFNQLDLPFGVDRDEAWRLLTAIRHQTATILPFETYVDIGYSTEAWYTSTRSMTLALREIEALCKQGSSLDAGLTDLRGSDAVMALLEHELAYALTMECTPVSVEHIHRVFNAEGRALQGIDRIVRNFCDLIYGIEAFDRRTIAPGLIEELYYRLIAGTEDLELPTDTVRPYRPRKESVYFDVGQSRNAICGFTDVDADPSFHPVIRLICISWFFWDFKVAPNLNAVVEIIFRHILTRRWGLPALAWVPFNRNGEHIGWNVYYDSIRDWDFGLDCTYLFCRSVDYLLGSTHKLATTVDNARERNARLREHLGGSLNPRQYAIVAKALASPDTPMRIEPHRRGYGITYPTARADYLGLVERGYLTKSQEGRAFVFRASEALRNLLDS